MSKRPYLLLFPLAERIYRTILTETDGKVLLGAVKPPCADDRLNLYRLLLTSGGRRLLKHAKTDEHFLSEERSDYENLVELLHLLPTLVGSGYYSFVRLMLEYFFGLSEIPAPENARVLWEQSLPLLRGGTFQDLLSPFIPANTADATEWVLTSSERLRRYETLDVYVSAYAESVKEASFLWLDLSGLNFVSPDPYHAKKGFLSVAAEKDDGEGRMYLTSQLLRVTGEICKSKNIPLILKGDFSESAVESLVRYLEKTDRLPRLLYAMPFDNCGEADRRYQSLGNCGLLDAICGIVPTNLPYCSIRAMSQTLQLSSMRYPLGKLCFMAEGSTEAEVRIGYERFIRLLSKFLSEAVAFGDISEETAISVCRSILTGAAIR